MIVPLTEKDIPLLVSAREVFCDAWTESMIVSAFNAGNFYGYICSEEVDGKPVFAGFITFTVAGESSDIADLFVVPYFRKKGIGNALMRAYIDGAKEKGATELFLEVRESNAPALALYKKFSFTEVSVRKKYYADGENALVLKKAIR